MVVLGALAAFEKLLLQHTNDQVHLWNIKCFITTHILRLKRTAWFLTSFVPLS